jgi:hypothetical protein
VIVVLIVADSVRSDAPGYAGGPSDTPNLDRLAREGAVASEAFASAGWTVPSMVALTTGTFPHRVGVARWRHPFPRRRPTLMSAFAAAGFDVQTLVHNPRFCLANMGFRGVGGDSEAPDQVIEALKAPPGTDRFVLVQHWWTHLPYRNEYIPKSNWRALCDEAIGEMGGRPEQSVPRLKGEYHDALSWFDRELLPRYMDAAASSGQDVLFCFTADHGENWGDSVPAGHKVEHMYDLHGRWLTDETTRVPLLFWGHGLQSQALQGFFRGVDLAPTLCALSGVPWPGKLPTDDHPTVVERGIGEEGEGLILDGLDLSHAVNTGEPTGVVDALTVTSHNAVKPPRYPKAGRRMWCRYGLRTAETRYQWDGLYGQREVLPMDGRTRSWFERLRQPEISTWSRFARERSKGVGPGDLLEKDLFERFPRPGDEDDDGGLEAPMRLLGYVD